MKKKGLTPVYQVMLLLFTLFFASCGGQSGQTAKNDGAKPVPDPKLNATYQRILVLPVDIDAKIAKDYSYASDDCRDGLLEGLGVTKRFQVSPIDAAPVTATERDTLIVKLVITDMRIASKGVRFAFGPMAGSSYANLRMILTDGHTGQVIRDKEFSSYNNAWGASFAMGSTDSSIPKDMGRIIGDYITAVVP